MAPNLFRILLAIVALYVLFQGRRDERYVGTILVLGVIATHLVVFGGFLWVALRSERFWPLWIAGLQLTTILGHVLKAIDAHLFSRAYGAALVFWSYPIVLILAIGTWRSHRRRLHEDGVSAI
jgi:hypothetical protein